MSWKRKYYPKCYHKYKPQEEFESIYQVIWHRVCIAAQPNSYYARLGTKACSGMNLLLSPKGAGIRNRQLRILKKQAFDISLDNLLHNLFIQPAICSNRKPWSHSLRATLLYFQSQLAVTSYKHCSDATTEYRSTSTLAQPNSQGLEQSPVLFPCIHIEKFGRVGVEFRVTQFHGS